MQELSSRSTAHSAIASSPFCVTCVIESTTRDTKTGFPQMFAERMSNFCARNTCAKQVVLLSYTRGIDAGIWWLLMFAGGWGSSKLVIPCAGETSFGEVKREEWVIHDRISTRHAHTCTHAHTMCLHTFSGASTVPRFARETTMASAACIISWWACKYACTSKNGKSVEQPVGVRQVAWIACLPQPLHALF